MWLTWKFIGGIALILFWLSAALLAFVAPEEYIRYKMIAGSPVGMMCFLLGGVFIMEEIDCWHWRQVFRAQAQHYKEKKGEVE